MNKKNIMIGFGAFVTVLAVAFFYMRPSVVSKSEITNQPNKSEIPKDQSIVVKPKPDPSITPDEVIAGGNNPQNGNLKKEEATSSASVANAEQEDTTLKKISLSSAPQKEFAEKEKKEEEPTYAEIVWSLKFYQKVLSEAGIIPTILQGDNIEIFWFVQGESKIFKIKGEVETFTFPGGKKGFSVWVPNKIKQPLSKNGEMFIKKGGIYALVGSPRTHLDPTSKKFYIVF